MASWKIKGYGQFCQPVGALTSGLNPDSPVSEDNHPPFTPVFFSNAVNLGRLCAAFLILKGNTLNGL